MKARRLLRRLMKPFVLALVASGLAFSLVVTTPTNAQAFVPAPALPAVWGATSMVLPQVMATSAVLGPVGWGIAGVTALGIGLYASKDYWLPYVTGALGGDKDAPAQGTPPSEAPPQAPAPAGTTAGADATGYFEPLLRQTSGELFKHNSTLNNRIRVNFYYSGNESYPYGVTRDAAATLYCKANGVVTKEFRTMNYNIGTGTGSSYPRTASATIGCTNLNHEIAGAVVGSFSGHETLQTHTTQRKGPENVAWFGTVDQAMMEAGYDPRGEDVKYRAEVECIRPDGSKSWISAESPGNLGGINMPSCAAAGLGHGTGATRVFVKPPNPDKAEEKVWDVQAPAPDPEKPLCDPSRPGSGCKLAVNLDGQPCVMGSFECENWSEIARDPNTAPRVSCQYGPYPVPVEICNPLERAYEPGGAPATDPNTDGNPSTRYDAQPDGSTQPRPQTDPNVSAPAIPGGAAAGAPEGSSTEAQQCFPQGWAMLNPVEWVMKPVGCAMAAAFQPKKDLQGRITAMQGQFSNKVPVSWFGGEIGNVSGGACPTDWALTVRGERVSLICGTAAEGIILGLRPILGAMLTVAALWPLVRSLFYAAIPVLKVNPS